MRNAFAPILRARPCPIFGRPVRLRGRPHRLQPDTSPHALRIPDRSGHPALRDISSSWLQVLGRVRLSPSCPFRLLHTRLLSRPARRYPRFRIRPSSSERRGDFNPHDSRAAQRTLRAGPTSPSGSSSATASGLPDNVPSATDGDSDEDLPVPEQKASAHARVYDDAGPACVLRYRHRLCCLLLDGKHQRPELVLRRSIPRLRPPL